MSKYSHQRKVRCGKSSPSWLPNRRPDTIFHDSRRAFTRIKAPVDASTHLGRSNIRSLTRHANRLLASSNRVIDSARARAIPPLEFHLKWQVLEALAKNGMVRVAGDGMWILSNAAGIVVFADAMVAVAVAVIEEDMPVMVAQRVMSLRFSSSSRDRSQ